MMDPRMLVWFGELAGISGLIVRLIKADALNATLARYGLKPIPGDVLPWIALGCGAVMATSEAIRTGVPFYEVLTQALFGAVAGATAVGGNETLKPVAHRVSPRMGELFFGKQKNAAPQKEVADDAFEGVGPCAEGLTDAACDDEPSGLDDEPTVSESEAQPQEPAKQEVSTQSSKPGKSAKKLLRKTGRLPLGVLLLTLGMSTGCATFKKAMPVLHDLLVDVQDAAIILEQIEHAAHLFFLAQPNKEAEAKVDAAINKARVALDIALRAGSGAEHMDYGNREDALGDFRVAFQELVDLLQSTGVMAPNGTLSANPNKLVIPTPLALKGRP